MRVGGGGDMEIEESKCIHNFMGSIKATSPDIGGAPFRPMCTLW